MKYFAAAISTVALGLALVGCGSDKSDTSKTSTTVATSTTPSAQAHKTIADYIVENHINETPLHHGDPGPTINLPVPDGWQRLDDSNAAAYHAVVLAQPPNPSEPPVIKALLSKLTGTVDPNKIIEFAPGELQNLPGYQGTGNGSSSTLSGFAAWQINGTYVKDGNTRSIAQKTVVIPSGGDIYVLQLNADSLQSDQASLMDATNIIDDQTTIVA